MKVQIKENRAGHFVVLIDGYKIPCQVGHSENMDGLTVKFQATKSKEAGIVGALTYQEADDYFNQQIEVVTEDEHFYVLRGFIPFKDYEKNNEAK